MQIKFYVRGLRYYSIFFIMQHTSERQKRVREHHKLKSLIVSDRFFVCFSISFISLDDGNGEKDAFVDNIKSKGKHHTVLW